MAEYKAFEETAYLLRRPANAHRLLEAMMQLATDQGTDQKLAP